MRKQGTRRWAECLIVSLLLTMGLASNATGFSRASAAVCTGDCGLGGRVSADEILTMINIALGKVDVQQCEAGDPNQSGTITLNEILRAVNNALNNCAETSNTPSPTPLPPTATPTLEPALPTPSNTPLPPTASPTISDSTPVVPTPTPTTAINTPTPSPTPTSSVDCAVCCHAFYFDEYTPACDLNHDGVINVLDLAMGGCRTCA